MRTRGWIAGVALCGALWLAGFASSAAAQVPPQAAHWADDPVQVYYPRSDCRGEQIELELWDRDASDWRRHPVHPRVGVDTCQVEDAGYLFNEIRWRCVEPPDSFPPPNWVVGLEVFDAAVMQSCNPQPEPEVFGELQLHVESPAPGQRVAEPEMEVAIQGSVHMDGIAGTDYDLLLVIDRSTPTREDGDDLLAAQVEAAQRLVEHLAPRLGAVRIGVHSYPNMPPLPDSPAGTASRRVIAFSDDAAALRSALDRVRSRGASGFQTFGSAFDFALAELEGKVPRSGARASARKVLVLAGHAKSQRPFGPGLADERYSGELRRRFEQAARGHVSLHLFAMGGIAEATSPELDALLQVADARFHRVLRPALETPFLARVPLPRVTRVVVENRTAGGGATPAEIWPNGRFATTLVAAAGTNRLWARATLSDGATTEREWDFEFDDRLVRERLLAAEREHMRRMREKRLTLRPMWDEELPPPPEELTPDVAAEPR